ACTSVIQGRIREESLQIFPADREWRPPDGLRFSHCCGYPEFATHNRVRKKGGQQAEQGRRDCLSLPSIVAPQPVRYLAEKNCRRESRGNAMFTLGRILCLIGIAAWPSLLTAQEFPSRTVKFVVPFPAGGPSDIMSRILTEKMAVLLGQSIVIENR